MSQQYYFVNKATFDLNNKGDGTPEYILENDIIIYDDAEYEDDVPDAIASSLRLWNKIDSEVIIPYTLPEGLSSLQAVQIDRAIEEFTLKTCIR